MRAFNAPILIFLLLIPNTSWRDWQSSTAPHLHQILQSGAVAEMNSRTAQTDVISSDAGIRTLLSGARMNASPDVSDLGYPAVDGNLIKSLTDNSVAIKPLDAMAAAIVGPVWKPTFPKGSVFIGVLPFGSAKLDARIADAEKRAAAADGIVVIASPNPSSAEYESFDQLTPIAVWRPGIQPSLLYSPSTRRAGLVTNTDIAPTIAAMASVALSGPAYGAPLSIEASPPTLDRLGLIDQIYQRSIDQSNNQLYVPWFALGLAGIIVLLTLGLTLPRGVRQCLGIAAIMPLLCTGLIACQTASQFIIFCVLIIAAAYFALDGSPARSTAANTWIAATALAFILIDAIAVHCAFTAGSLLGYTPAEGARYYGLGNEAMGVAIGAATVLSVSTLNRRSGAAIGIALWLAVAGILGFPTIGAKAGGLLAAMVGLTGYIIASGSAHIKRTHRAMALAAICVALAVGVAALVVMGRFSPSHVTATISQAGDFGPAVIWSVAIRKAAMDIHLMVHSVWMLVLLACVAGTFLMAGKANGDILRLPAQRPLVITGAFATMACLVLNDAGVVAAALCAVFVWSRIAIAASAFKLESKNEEAAPINIRNVRDDHTETRPTEA